MEGSAVATLASSRRGRTHRNNQANRTREPKKHPAEFPIQTTESEQKDRPKPPSPGAAVREDGECSRRHSEEGNRHDGTRADRPAKAPHQERRRENARGTTAPRETKQCRTNRKSEAESERMDQPKPPARERRMVNSRDVAEPKASSATTLTQEKTRDYRREAEYI